jgi:hypothetical protein
MALESPEDLMKQLVAWMAVGCCDVLRLRAVPLGTRIEADVGQL